jgi:predicted membrane protein
MSKESSSKTSGLKRFIRRLILFILFIEAVTAAVLKVLEYFKTKKADEENPTRDFKEFFNFLGSKNVTLSDSNVSGVITKNIMGATSLDLSGVSFKEDGFISLSALCSAVYIVVPAGVNVKIDGLIKASRVECDVPEDSSLPTLYIASKITCSSVYVTTAE